MTMSVTLYFVGTAGSGKTRLTNTFQLWMQSQGLKSIIVNLDPGAERLPYAPEVDIRDWIDIKGVMSDYDLGPNGAQIICADMLALKVDEVKSAIEEYETDYVLVDTPGQIELFAYRKSSGVVVDTLGENAAMAFLFDPVLSKTPMGLTSLSMLCGSIQFRFSVPFINALSKIDLLRPEELERILSWSEDSDKLYDALISQPSGMRKEMNIESFRVLEDMGLYRALTPISSETNFGMEDLYNILQQTFMGGEDLGAD